MIYRFYFFFKSGNVLRLHIFHNYHTECALAEVIQQNVLTLYGFHSVGQVIEHIVIYSCSYHTEYRGYQQYDRNYKNDYSVLCYPFA